MTTVSQFKALHNLSDRSWRTLKSKVQTQLSREIVTQVDSKTFEIDFEAEQVLVSLVGSVNRKSSGNTSELAIRPKSEIIEAEYYEMPKPMTLARIDNSVKVNEISNRVVDWQNTNQDNEAEIFKARMNQRIQQAELEETLIIQAEEAARARVRGKHHLNVVTSEGLQVS